MRAPGSDGPILEAIGRAGLLGLTAKQLAVATNRPADLVSGELRDLARRQAVTRLGRGLWVLTRFASAAPPQAGFRGPADYERAFRRQTGGAWGPYTGEVQAGANVDLPVHRWWPYVQGFSAGFVREELARAQLPPGATVLDPFAGSGTVLVEARRAGLLAVGRELMPIAAFAARAKLDWDVDPDELRRLAAHVTGRIGERPSVPGPFLRETSRQFPPAVLRELRVLKGRLLDLEPGPLRTAGLLIFAGLLVPASRLKRSPCLGYTTKTGLTAQTPHRLFREGAARMADDLEALQHVRSTWGPRAYLQEVSAGSDGLLPESIDLAVTSPPYVNGMDYVMNYKLEMAWLDQVRSYDDLARLRAAMVACDNVDRATVARHRPGAAVADDPWISDLLDRMRKNLRGKSGYRRSDMADVVAKYFDDLVPVLARVHDALRPGGRFLVVNGDSLMAGTYVPGDLLFARLATTVGFEVERLEVARTRRSGQRRNFRLRESVLRLRRPRAG